MNDIELTEDQRRAIETLEGPLFVAAGAGSGKTGVVTRRFVHAIAVGKAAMDEILTITFTRKAAAEMMERIRGLLRHSWTIDDSADPARLERMSMACRQIERAQISTIDGFCASVLRAHALAAGIDPNFAAVDESQAAVIQEEAFDICLKAFVEQHGDKAIELISAYDPNLDGSLFRIITGTFDTLRSQGRDPVLPVPESRLPAAEQQLQEAIAEARAAVAALKKPTNTQVDGCSQLGIMEQALEETDDFRRMELAASACLKGGFTRVKSEFEKVKEAHEFLVTEVRSLHAAKTLGLLGDLLIMFARQYETEKHRKGALDFGDLSIKTRDLLRDDDIRRSVSSRFKLVMVDEFQDTNELQFEIVRQVSNGNLCLVGDENQSIYRFRNAVVELFREQKEAAKKGDYLIELRDNFRSQPQILRFVDHIFKREGMLEDGYLQLTPAAGPDGRGEDRRVEIIFVDEGGNQKDGSQKVPADTAKKAEAQLVAEKIDLLLRSGYEEGDIAILVRTAAQADIYRNALGGIGIESYLAVGRSYFEKLELGDIVNMFRLLINPLDDLALFAALRSPMAGLSDDALYRLRQAALGPTGKKLPVWEAIGELTGSIEGMRPPDDRKLSDFLTAFRHLRESSKRKSLTAISKSVVDFNDYSATTAARNGGKRKLANLVKLLDMAADFEYSWGNDLAEFTEFLQRQKNVRAKESEAPTEEEGVRAVRILTMHGAKGLEFPVVVLPDLGLYDMGHHHKTLLLDRHGERIGLDFKTIPEFAGSAFEYETLKDEIHKGELREEKRLGYVAMTRAKQHLILSGRAPADKMPTKKQSDPPFDWLRKHLTLCWERDNDLGQVDHLQDINGTEVGLTLCLDAQAASARFDVAFARSRQAGPESVNPDVSLVPPRPVYVPAMISPTAIDTFAACPRRYFLERVLDAGSIIAETGGHAQKIDEEKNRDEKTEGMSRQYLGTLVHALLEKAEPPLARTNALEDSYLDKIAFNVLPSGMLLTSTDRERARQLVANLGKAQVVEELKSAAATGRLKRELSFSTLLGEEKSRQIILKGQIDAFVEREEGSMVVDYKTGGHTEEFTASLAAAGYANQMAAYALAASRLKPGPVEVALVFLDEPVEEVHASFDEEQISGLGQELQKEIEKMSDGIFDPLPVYASRSCSQCAGNLGVLPVCPTAASNRYLRDVPSV